jgi:hypothetical protein
MGAQLVALFLNPKPQLGHDAAPGQQPLQHQRSLEAVHRIEVMIRGYSNQPLLALDRDPSLVLVSGAPGQHLLNPAQGQQAQAYIHDRQKGPGPHENRQIARREGKQCLPPTFR